MRRSLTSHLPSKAALILAATLLLGGVSFSRHLVAWAAAVLPDFPNWYTNGEEVGDVYGTAVEVVGDVNGDSIDDLLVGAPKATYNEYREGVVYAFYGSVMGLDTDHDWKAGSGITGAEFGSALAGVGDVDHDGYDDVLAGAPAYIGDFPACGAAFLYMGSPLGLETTPAWVFQGDKQDAGLGSAVDAAGDLNQDGYLDLLIGVHHYTEGEFNEGQVRVYLGSAAGFDSASYWGFKSGQYGASLGAAVAGAGDFNGDGFLDLAASAPYYDATIADVVVKNTGAVYAFYGVADGLPSTTEYWLATGATENEKFGLSIATAGDLNQDGFDDLLVGVPGYDATKVDQGAVYVYLGSPDGLPAAPSKVWVGPLPVVLNNQYIPSGFGSAVASGGDINTDGYLDVIVGAPTFTQNQSAEGGIFIYFGVEQGLVDNYGWRNFGQQASTLFGAAVASGDVNQDGRSDVLVGAPTHKLQQNIVGRAAAFYAQPGFVYGSYLPLVSK